MVDEETVVDLNAISAEARRLAQMVTSLCGDRADAGDEGRPAFAYVPSDRDIAYLPVPVCQEE